MKSDHFAFEVSNMARSIEFYRDVLGLPFKSDQTDHEHGERFSFFSIDGGDLELLQDTTCIKPTPLNSKLSKPYCPHFAIQCEDFDKKIADLKEKGIPIIGPFVIENEVTWCYFPDPDNNAIELVKWLK